MSDDTGRDDRSGEIDKAGLAALRALLGRDIGVIYAPTLDLDLRTGAVSAPVASFWLDGRSADFVTIETEWVQADCEDYHLLRPRRTARPLDLDFTSTGKGQAIDRASTCVLALGRIVGIEIITSCITVTAEPPAADGPAETSQVVYDRAINLYGVDGALSLSTPFGTIVGDLGIKPAPLGPDHEAGRSDTGETRYVRVLLDQARGLRREIDIRSRGLAGPSALAIPVHQTMTRHQTAGLA